MTFEERADLEWGRGMHQPALHPREWKRQAGYDYSGPPETTNVPDGSQDASPEAKTK